VSSFAFVEAAGPLYGLKLMKDAMGSGRHTLPLSPAPRFENSLDAAQKAQTAAAVLRAMSLTTGHAPLVLLIGHGTQVTNNPHESAYHCGACGGQTGEVSSRLLATLLNDPETRAALPARGITLPEDTIFVAGLHDTVTDTVTLYPDTPAPDHADALAQAHSWLKAAGHIARSERAQRLPGASGDSSPSAPPTGPKFGLNGAWPVARPSSPHRAT